MMLIKLAWRNIWRNKKRSIITITAIVIAVFLAVVMRSLQLGVYDNMIQNIVGSYSGHIQIHSNGYWEEQTIDNAFEYNDSLIDKIFASKGPFRGKIFLKVSWILSKSSKEKISKKLLFVLFKTMFIKFNLGIIF